MPNPAPKTLCESFQSLVAAHPDRVAIRTPGDTTVLTWRDYGRRVERIAAGLAGLGVGKGDTVGIMLTNSPEFHLVDTAALHAGATPFSIYNTNPPEKVRYLFGNAGNRVVVCETQFLDVVEAAARAGDVEHIVCVDGEREGVISLAELENSPAPGFDFEASWRAVDAGDVLTIVYTSGTTGPPKGVELTHANLIANTEAAREVADIAVGDRVVSYLPDAHAANRWVCHWGNLFTGVEITTVANPKEVLAALTDARPTFFVGVPAIWYKIKAGVEAKLAAEKSPVKKRLGAWAIGVGRRVVRLEGKPVPFPLRLRHRIADRLVLSRVRAALGLDEVKVAASSAAPIEPDALEFMLALGVTVCEAWGMSELTAAATANRPGRIRVGTVGTPFSGVEVRIAEDGELLVRGPIVMKGYRGEPEKTAEILDADGWLHSGDIATIDEDGYVRIVDRKKELIINAAGKNMSPSNIENAVKVGCPLIGSVLAVGDRRPYVVALVTLDPDACAAHAAERGLPDAAPAALATDPEVVAMVEDAVERANGKLSRVEQVKKTVVLPDVWEPGGDEVTPTMKLRRKPIAARYADRIEALYSA
ncbi:AMP-dependent synthetase/ligase [Amycolatopsis sp. CA-230715]|uniref:AMP-dependent synthetase/ligase n=1 Tax=Amycolatopsis sp. CA-230715 TaxID=2745196 RepID=UPI001C0277A7|nr:long-chain fatty acid--CoA ligase [Amycolatopsis sp. CA-230715]QWF76747.1 Long-chain-fatty-acid--CoA ligase FadD15 [Amycolatopsis sp. CA-230715]